MKICFVCSDYPPGPHGGIGTMTQLLARALVRAGHRARVVGVYPSSYPAPDRENDEGVDVWRLREPSGRTGWIRARRQLLKLIAMWSRAGEVDVVEVPDWQGWAAGWPRLPVPVVVRLNGSATYFGAEMGFPVQWLVRQLEQRSLARSDFWCSASRYTADQTRRVLAHPAPPDAILYNPVELPPSAPWDQRSRHSVVFSGTLTEKKGVISLMRAWPIVARAVPRAELQLFGKDGTTGEGGGGEGEGSMRAHLASLLQGQCGEDRIHFHGHVNRAELLRVLGHARVAIFPSYAEAFALAPLEAMAAGCPTIYSTRGSGPELVHDGRDGLLVDPDRPEQIAEALVRVLEDDALAAALGAAGRRRVTESFSLEAAVERNAEFYARCIRSFGIETHTARTRVSGWRMLPSTREAGVLTDCSLVIATYRRPDEISTLLRQLQELPDVPAEVIVVDGSPDDDSERAVTDWAFATELTYELMYVRSPAGLTRQRNVGIDASTGELVFFLDDDCHPQPGYFAAIRQLYASDASREIVAICGSPINEMNKPLSRRWRLRLALGISPAGRGGDYQRMGASMPLGLAQPFEGARPVAAMPGCAMSFRRAVLARHRFSRFFYGYSQGEDLEMSLRVARDGVVLWCGDAHVVHDHAPSGRPASMEKGRMEVRNRFFIWKRHARDVRAMDRFRFWADTAYAIALDAASFIARPTSAAPLRHMAGCMQGAVGCLLAPPRYEEPAATSEYDFDIRTLPFGSDTLAGAAAAAERYGDEIHTVVADSGSG